MKKLLLFLFAAFAFAACEQAPIEEQSGVRADALETIKVGFEDDETRIQLNGAQKTVWTKNDQVSVFYRSNGNQKWEYTGETGARTAELKRVEAASGTRDMDRVVVVYPYNEDYYINPSTFNVQASLPAVQHYLADSYGTDGNIMISSSEYNQFSLKSVCGWLKIQLTGDGEKIKSITLRGNNDEQVAGELYINSEDATAVLASEMGDADDNNAGGALVFDDTILHEVVLDCGEGVELIPVVTSFYIALPPQSFEQGITLEITDDSGYTMTQSTSKLVSIERNHIQPMTAFEFINPSTPTTPKPANNEIWYTATEQVEPYWDDANTYGVRLVSNTWDEATGNGVYTFAGDVTKVGAEAFLECKKLQSVTLPDSATEIGSNAFKNCDGLKEVTIGDGITSIGSNAFYDCDALTTISFGDGLQTIGYQAFYSCYALKEIVLGGNIATLGEKVFYQCSNLSSVVIGDSVTTIGGSSFYECYKLNSVIIGSGLTEISSYLFKSCSALQSIVLPDSVKTIKSYAFQSCSKLENITFGDNVETIDPDAFYNCNAIKAIYGTYATSDGRALIMDNKVVLYAKASGSDYTIPDGVTTIANSAFSYANLTSVTIPEGVTSIEAYAFSYCSSLKKVYLKALNPPSCGSYAFSNNASGRRFYVYDEAVNTYKKLWSSDASNIYGNGSYDGEDTTNIYYTTTDGETVSSEYLSIKENTYTDGQGKMVVCGKLDKLPEKVFYDCDNLTSIEIPDGITTIGNYAFQYCSNLTSVTISNSVSTIGEYAFYYCSNLTNVTIPNSVNTIGKFAFSSCSDLSSVTIPDGVTAIGDYVFYNCYNLASVTIPDSVTAIGNSAFDDCPNLASVTIPDSVTVIGNSAFDGCWRLTNITIPNNVTTIGSSAFCDCGLTSVTIPNSVTSIGANAFNCSCLKEFKGKFASEDGRCLIQDETLIAYANNSGDEYIIPETITKIGAYAFYEHPLSSITLHENVTHIEDHAFYSYSDPCRIYVTSSEPAYLDGYSIFNTDEYNLKIFVPQEAENRYKSDYDWKNYAMLIYPYDYNRVQTNYEIWYTSINDVVVEPNDRNAFGDARIVSNNSQNGINIITFDREITEIGYWAFANCDNLTSVTIPGSVTRIGEYSFYCCYGLSTVYLNDGVEEIDEYAFAYSALDSITLPNGLRKIGDDAFNGCNLTSITIPDSVVELGRSVFAQCRELSEFKGVFASDDGRCLIKDNTIIAYAEASGDEFIIPNGVTKIGENVFSWSYQTKCITIPDSVTEISNGAFSNCQGMEEINMGNGVSIIGDNAFWDCNGLTSVSIPDSVTSIGVKAFASCNNLQEFKGKYATDDGRCLIVNGALNTFANGCGITEYTIPSNVTSIGDSAFYDCDRLISVTIPNSVTTIGANAFDSCSSLTSVTIPNSVTSIGNYAFSYCSSLASVTIGESVTKIGWGAFYTCSNLTSVYCKATTPPSLGEHAFMYWDNDLYNNIGCDIYVPMESVEAYKSANYWKEYAADIVGYNF